MRYVDKGLLDYLCCPVCYGSLHLKVEEVCGDKIVEGKLLCGSCGRIYEIRDGIPRMIARNFLGFNNRLQRIFYDFYASLYDRVEGRFASLLGFCEEELRNRVVSAMNMEKGDNVLEVCIGTGSNVPYYRKYTDGLIVGIDISEEMLKICLDKVKRYGWRNIELIQSCAEYLPFKPNIFDRVLIGGAISYFSDPGRALREVGRVAKPLAKIVIYEQITILEKLMKKDLLPLKIAPKELVLIKHTYLFKRHFYLTEFIKQRSS